MIITQLSFTYLKKILLIIETLSSCNSHFLNIVNKIIWKYSITFTDIFKNKKLLLNEALNDNDWKTKIINELLD